MRHRRSIRLREYDYRTPGAYFITIVTARRQMLFGSVVDDEMRLNPTGSAVRQVWNELPTRFTNIEVDEFVVMPNHVHGIVWLTEPGIAPLTEKGRASPAPTVVVPGLAQGPVERTDGTSLGEVIGALKSLSALVVNRLLPRSGSLWQRNYHEHIIRNDDDLMETRQYIIDNRPDGRWTRTMCVDQILRKAGNGRASPAPTAQTTP